MIFLMDNPNFPEKQTPTSSPSPPSSSSSWGTWEELLLACAVHRFGTHSWEAVAAELRKRTSNLHLLTPHVCKRKFHDLRRRFNQSDAVSAANTGDDKSPTPWLDQLRQLRLDELRRELQRYDLSIVSLQLKVERLKEIREKSDREKTGEEAIEQGFVEPETDSPEKKDISGEASVRDGESNTTDPKPEVPKTGVTGADKGSENAEPDEPAKPAVEEFVPVEKSGNPAVEDSCNGSSDSVAKERAVVETEKGSSGEVGESAAESKGGEERTKASRSSSEVSKPVGLDEPCEPDQEDQSPAIKRVPVESQPLIKFLEILRSHKFASFFERRLHSQDTPTYTKMIRKHVDFEMVQSRLDGGWYSRCSRSLFFRDLLLICNNAIVFFGKKSPEYKAACELQSLVSKEMALQAPKEDPPCKEETPTQPAPPAKPEPETSDSLLAKSKLSLPLTACRKRSSITARASTSSSGPDRKKEQTTTSYRDVKPAISWKQKEECSDEVEELHVTKKRRKERPRSSSRNNSNKNGRSRGNTNNDRNSDANANANVGFSSKVATSNENSDSKAETEKKSSNNASGKKRSAADFLSRMKRTSSSKKGLLPETSKTLDNNSKGGRAEQRKNRNGKGNNAHGEGSRRSSGERQATKEQGSPAKRSVGRPSKRAAAPTTAGPAKRARHRG